MRLARLLSLGVAAILLFGCGGGGGGTSGTGNALTRGQSGLNALASGQQPTNQQTLQSILDLFQQALQQDPNSAEAHFGAAICLAGVVAQEVDGYSGNVAPVPLPPVPPPSVGSGGGGTGTVVMPPAPPPARATGTAVADAGEVVPVPVGTPSPPPVPPPHVIGLFWNLDAGLANPYSLLHMLAPIADLGGGLIPFYGYPQDDAVQRQQMLDGLNTVEQHLAAVEADPSFSVTLSVSGQSGASVTIGLPEVYLFDAYVNSLRAEVALSLAYIRDPGSNWTPPLPPFYAAFLASGGQAGGASAPGPLFPSLTSLDKDKDGKLTPDEYLPPSPFLTLRDPKLLQTAQQAMLAVVDREQKGIDGVFARPVDGHFLIPNSASIHDALTAVHDKILPLIQQAATGPVTLNVPTWYGGPLGGPQLLGAAASGSRHANATRSVTRAVFQFGGNLQDPSSSVLFPLPQPTMQTLTFDLAAWFTHPPADLKVFAPTLTLNANGWPDPSKTVYPDPTFGGLFPDGLKTDLPF